MFHVCKDDMLIGFTDFGCLGVRLQTLRRNCSSRNELHKNLKLYKKMGGGSSVLSPELSKSLTQPSINEFHRFQLECESKHMTPVEMYLFLSKKYEELVLAEKSAVKEIAAAMKKDRKEKKDAAKVEQQQAMVHSASAVSSQQKDDTNVTSLRRRSLGNDISSPRTSNGRKTADGIEVLSLLKGETATPSSLRITSPKTTDKQSSDSPTVRRAKSKEKDPNGELSPSTLILSNGKAVPIATSAELEENTIAEELAIELAAMATEEEFKYRDSDDEDSKVGERSNFSHDPYVESVVGKVFHIKDTSSGKSTPQIKALVDRLMPSPINTGGSPVASLSPSPVKSHDISTRTAIEGHHNRVDDVVDNATDFVIGDTIIHHDVATGTYTCAVCRMNFECRSSLDVHLECSPLHSMNLKIRQEIYQGTIMEAERLGKLAKMAISKMMPSGISMGSSVQTNGHPDHTMNHHEEVQHRWKRAINKVISNRLKQHYMPIIEELFDTPNGVKMLYAGEKIFYQVKTHIDVHIYLHIVLDVVEIVIHSLPNRKQREKSKVKVAQEIREHDQHHPFHEGHHDALCEDELHSSDYLKPFIKPLSRLYMDFSILVPMVLGIDRAESGLSMDPHALVLQNHVKNQIESNQFVSSITSRYAAINTTSKDAAEAKKMSKTIEQAIVSFILNRLRVNLISPDSKNEKDPTKKFVIGFDFSNYAGHPLIHESKLKPDFKPVPLTDERIRKHYDRKLIEEVSHEVHMPQDKTGIHISG